MRFFDFFKKPKKPTLIAIDAGSALIKTAVFEVAGRPIMGEPRLMAGRLTEGLRKKVFYAPTGLGDNQDQNYVPPVSQLREIIFNYIKELKKVPDGILIGIGEAVGQSIIESFQFKDLDQRDDITEKKLKAVFEEVIARKKESLKPDLVIASANILRIFLNGYELENFNRKIRGVELILNTLFLIAAKARWSQLLTIPKMFGGINVKFLPMSFVLARAISSKFSEKNGCVVDVGNLSTRVLVFRNGTLDQIEVIDIGASSFISALSQEFKINAQEAASLARQYSSGMAAGFDFAKVKDVFSKEVVVFQENFFLAMDKLRSVEFLPNKFYIIGGGVQIPEIASLFEEKQFMGKNFFVGQPAFSVIKAEDFGLVDGGILQGSSESGLASLIFDYINF